MEQKTLKTRENTMVSASDVISSNSVVQSDQKKTFWTKVKETFVYLGPAWLVAMAYLDPGNIEGDLAAGALRSPDDPERGFRLLWVLLWATIVGFVLQSLGIKLGVKSGNDIASLAYKVYPRWICYFLWFVTELCLIGIDAQAVMGSAVAFNLLFGVPPYVGILITLSDTFIILLVTLYGTQKLEIFFVVMILFMGVCFFINMFTAKPPIIPIIKGIVIPLIPKNTIQFTIVLIGCVIMPHNFFLQTSVVQSRTVDRSNPAKLNNIIKIYTYETFVSLFVSLTISIAIVSSFANINVALNSNENISLNNAHEALTSALGKMSSIVWSLGLLSAGTCSTMAGTYCGQFVLEGFLHVRIKYLWVRMLVTRLISIIPVLFILLMTDKTFETVSNGVNILQALWMPFIVTLLIKFSDSPVLMNGHKLSLTSKITGYISGLALISFNVAYIIILTNEISLFLCIPLVFYIIALIYMWYRPLHTSELLCANDKNALTENIL